MPKKGDLDSFQIQEGGGGGELGKKEGVVLLRGVDILMHTMGYSCISWKEFPKICPTFFSKSLEEGQHVVGEPLIASNVSLQTVCAPRSRK